MSSPIPADARRSLFVYNLCFPFVLLALLPGYALRLLRRGNFRENFGQRLGRYSAADQARFAGGGWLWLHSISVGETFIALKLATALQAQKPDLRIAISVTTSTGFALARAAANERLAVLYNPIDRPVYVRAAFDLLQPAQLVLIEGEAWPNLLAESAARDVPSTLVNARLSPRSERRMLIARFWIAPIFRLLDRICAPEPDDVRRWCQLGMPREKIAVTGSIKFDDAPVSNAPRKDELRALLEQLGVAADRPIIVAGSTWNPEEEILAKAYLRLRAEFPRLFLIIVPRHVERTPEIQRTLEQLSLRVALRSSVSAGSSADLLLVDTTGELATWYEFATVVFVGKSLPGVKQIGGQNCAEPVALGKAVLFGPHMENFQALAGHLLVQNAAISVADGVALEAALATLLRDPAALTALGNRARNTLSAHAGATSRTAQILLHSAA